VEAGYLVVVQVGGYIAGGREVVGHHVDVAGVYTVPGHPLGVVAPVVSADRREHGGGRSQQGHRVGDVGRHPTPLPLERVHQERHVQHVDLVGQDVVLEMPREIHDVVVRY